MIVLAVLFAVAAPQAGDGQLVCSYDNAILSLDFEAFDQDMDGGWRAIASQPGCDGKAADVIRAYRARRENQLAMLYWHEGQLRAAMGESAAAIKLMRLSRKAEESPLDDPMGWNPYVDTTIAFLAGDRSALEAARRRLAKWPKPTEEDWPRLNGSKVPWPPNLDVVDGLAACFGQAYKIANSSRCQPGAESDR